MFPVAHQGRFIPAEAYAKTLDVPSVDGLWTLHFQEKNLSIEDPSNTSPLRDRLQLAGKVLKILPGRYGSGEWYSPHALKIRFYDPSTKERSLIGNFTAFSNQEFLALQSSYLDWEQNPEHLVAKEHFLATLYSAYQTIAGTPYLETSGKSLHYPNTTQLELEALYSRYPLLKGLIGLYAVSFLGLLWGIRSKRASKTSLFLLMIAFISHTVLLACRWYLLGRPPVSNMAETVIYVPWIIVLLSLFIFLFIRNNVVLIASTAAASVLLMLLELSKLNSGLETVQPVLDSRFWLMTHVLMVVGSYGVFILSGALGHFYLASFLYYHEEKPLMKRLAQAILQTIYLGTGLLIVGTILGGVWAAESWGRFWDWDPKESWAFISICVYLLGIHAYRFGKIGNFGLALGSIIGLLAISFTWYGVNYILGTGFHSYGFGSGGTGYYVGFILSETLFLAASIAGKWKSGQHWRSKN